MRVGSLHVGTVKVGGMALVDMMETLECCV